jgi:hypothetical protein
MKYILGLIEAFSFFFLPSLVDRMRELLYRNHF